MLRRLFILLLTMAFAFLVSGCRRGNSGPPRMARVRVGMTVQQVEQTLGKPLSINTPPTIPGTQIRAYPGDGDHSIYVIFKDGISIDVTEMVPKRKLPVS